MYMSPSLYNGLKENKDDIEHDPFKSDLFSLGFCFVYAATMDFNLLYDLRNINNDIDNFFFTKSRKYTMWITKF